MGRDMIDVARAIQRVIPRKYKGWMEGLIADLDYVAPECRAERVNDRLWAFIPYKPTEQWQFEALAIWTTKSIDEIKEIADRSMESTEAELDFHDPVLCAWEGDEVICVDDASLESSSCSSKNMDESPIPGKKYIIEKIEVYDCHTDVFLKEFPGVSFNSESFTVA